METNLDTATDEKLNAAADRLLAAAMDYWKEHRRVTGGAGVVWVGDVDGRLVILTRGEYRATLLENIPKLHYHADELPLRGYNDPPRATDTKGER